MHVGKLSDQCPSVYTPLLSTNYLVSGPKVMCMFRLVVMQLHYLVVNQINVIPLKIHIHRPKFLLRMFGIMHHQVSAVLTSGWTN